MPAMGEPPQIVARAPSAAGEVVLRRRGIGGALELIIDGVFAMDTVDVSTETAMAGTALASHPCPQRVLVGGLGLGFTTRAVLGDERVSSLDVVELAEPLVRWCAAQVVPEFAGLSNDDRLHLYCGDVLDTLEVPSSADRGRLPSGPWDLILLDVDNGPDFLIRPGNASLYQPPLASAALKQLIPGGHLVIWSSHPAPALLSVLAEAADQVGGQAEEEILTVRRDGRVLTYALYRLSRPAAAVAGS